MINNRTNKPICDLPAVPPNKNDRGMTLVELITVIAITSITMSMILMAIVSIAKHDGINLVRQQRTDQVRQVSFWLGDALSYASTDNPDAGTRVFESADAHKMTFTSALPIEGVAANGTVSNVTLVLGEKCWTGEKTDQDGLLRRCVHSPSVDSSGVSQPMCDFGSSGCKDVFDDFVVARNVDDADALFTYYFTAESGLGPVHTVDTAQLGSIIAVELKVKVNGDEPADRTSATLFKRYSVSQWRRL
jgi:prepilin-type N-terminal cleavage/methylation domain-containing protein